MKINEIINGQRRSLLKMLRIMKLTAILLFSSMVAMSATTYSQVTKLNLSAEKSSLVEIFKQIEDQSDFYFFYNKDELKSTEHVSVKMKDVLITDVLNQLLADTDLSYKIIDKYIVIKKKEADLPEKSAQPEQRITGKVTDQNGSPIPGVSVIVKGTTLGQITDNDGNYSISVPDGGKILLFSFVGMDTQEISAEGKRVINVTMKESVLGLEEVVVVGYGTQKKINLTGSVDAVSGAALANRPAPNVSSLIQGVSPNLNIGLSTRGGEPGSSHTWNIRGVGSIAGGSSPLILIDGIEGSVDNLDPESIESVSVLKDASASSIYGSRAPYGVVLITTKKGQKNQTMRLHYNFNQSWASPINLPEFVDAYSWALAYNQAAANAKQSPVYPDEQVDRIKKYIEGTYPNEYNKDVPPNNIWMGRYMGNANYNYPKMFFKNDSPSTKHNVSIEGGDSKTSYYVSGGLYDQGGLYNWGNDSYRRYNMIANLSSQIANWIRFDFSTRYARSQTDYPLGVVTQVNNRDYNFRQFWTFGPMTPMYLADGSGTIVHPIIRALQDGGRNKTTSNDFWIKFGTELEPVKGWKTNVSYNYNIGVSGNTQTPHPVNVTVPNGTIGNIGQATADILERMENNNYYLLNALTSYEKTAKGHYFKAMIGYERELSQYKSLYGSKKNLISVEVPSINAATGDITLGSNANHWATEAAFGRLNYNYKEKYLLEASGRYNGSSRFSKDTRWGFFPSFSAGYNIAREDFWSPLEPFINTLKIRGSYGSLGNQNVPNYLYLSNVPVNSNLNYIVDGVRPIYALSPAIISGSLTWETVTTTNIGLDLSFLRNRLGLTVDLFNRKTTDMFGPSQDLPSVLGTSAPLENNADLESRGFEITLDWKDRLSNNFDYFIKASLADSRIKITKYRNLNNSIDNWYNGKNYGEIWGYLTDGIIQKDGETMPDQTKYYPTWGPGDMKYKDLDGNNILNDGTRTLEDHGDLRVIGNTSPRYNIGITAGFNWKSFSFSMFWQGIGKRDYLPDQYAYVFWGFSLGGYGASSIDKGPALDYWRPANETNALGPNTDAYFPKPYWDEDQANKNRLNQSRYVLDASYLRLKNIQIGYTIPKRLTKKVFVETAKFYVSGENLLTLTNLPKVFDPETCFVSDTRMGGLQQASIIYPLSKMFSCGINLTF